MRDVVCSYAGNDPVATYVYFLLASGIYSQIIIYCRKTPRRAKAVVQQPKVSIVAVPVISTRKGTIAEDLADILPFHAGNLAQLQEQLRLQFGSAAKPDKYRGKGIESKPVKKVKSESAKGGSKKIEERKRKASELDHLSTDVAVDRKRVTTEERRVSAEIPQPKPTAQSFPSVLIAPTHPKPTLAPSPVILDRLHVKSLALPSHISSPEPQLPRPLPVRFQSDPSVKQSAPYLSYALDEKLKRDLIDGPARNTGERRFAIDSMPPPRRPSLSRLPYNGGRLVRSISGPVRMFAGVEPTVVVPDREEQRRASMNAPATLPWTTTRVVIRRKSSITYTPPTPPHSETTFSPRTEHLLERPLPLVIPASQSTFDYPSPTTPTSTHHELAIRSTSEYSFHHSYKPTHPHVLRRAASYPGSMAAVRGLPQLNSPRFYFQLRDGRLPREGLPSIGNWYDRAM